MKCLRGSKLWSSAKWTPGSNEFAESGSWNIISGGLAYKNTSSCFFYLCALLAWCSVFSEAQRDPALKQIDVPHPYYFREMYLPQMTTGPSSVAWLPDSR